MSKSIQAPPFQWPVRVYYEDTDAGGVVYHARYLHFMERARTEWLRSLGFEQDRLRSEQGILFAVRKMTLDFVRPARFNQELSVYSRIIGNGRASIDFSQQVADVANDHVYCRGTVNVACIDATRLRPARIPGVLLQALMPASNVVEHGGSAHGL
jgi:acyl-CoA thioester hydrolase